MTLDIWEKWPVYRLPLMELALLRGVWNSEDLKSPIVVDKKLTRLNTLSLIEQLKLSLPNYVWIHERDPIQWLWKIPVILPKRELPVVDTTPIAYTLIAGAKKIVNPVIGLPWWWSLAVNSFIQRYDPSNLLANAGQMYRGTYVPFKVDPGSLKAVYATLKIPLTISI